MKQLNEGLDHNDMINQLVPVLSVDEYSAKMGTDDEIITLAFTVTGEQASKDLATWFERGYDYVLDSQVSTGEISRNKYLVFVEMVRRLAAPERIIELLDDLKTLTALELSDWKIKISNDEIEADQELLKQNMILSPHQYRINTETDLNEMRELSGVEPRKIYTEQDAELKAFKAIAGL
jgi:hypothetical protein